MSARSAILERIRRAHGCPGGVPTPQDLAAARGVIARHEVGPLPSEAHPADPIAQFRKECERLQTTCAEISALSEIPGEVARYLAAHGLDRQLVVWREFAGLDWQGAGLEADHRPANGADRTGLTGCFCAIAETGTVLLLSAPQAPKVTALLPETHLCIARKSRMVNTMEEAFALMRAEIGEPPRATFFVSGPSRTADIEQTIVIGAHGPYRVHVILVP